MKAFVFYILKVTIILLIILYVLELCYTQVYIKSQPRNKIDLVLQTANENFDMIALGSSRANNHINTNLLYNKGFKVYNFGVNGATLEESALLLELLSEKNSIDRVFLEVDLNLRDNFISEGTRISFMPYIASNTIIDNYYKNKIAGYNYLRYMPFYRYLIYDSKIGFRSVLLKAIGYPSKHLTSNGFNALIDNKNQLLGYDLSSVAPKKNISFEYIKTLCKEKDIHLLPISTPMCENTKGIEYFEKINEVYPEVINLEPVVKSDKYFSTCGHMNKKGADLFTNYLIDNFLK